MDTPDQKQEVMKVPKSRIVNIADISIPEFTDIKELIQIRQGKRTAYLEKIAENLVINIPTRSVKGGKFDTVTTVEYHQIDDDDWNFMQMEKAKQMDMARSMQLDVDEYKKNGIMLPKNWTTISTDYYNKEKEVNDLFCQMFLGEQRSKFKLCDQQFLQDTIDSYELKHRLGLVNLGNQTRGSENISSIT